MSSIEIDLVTIGKIERHSAYGASQSSIAERCAGPVRSIDAVSVDEPGGQMVDRTVTHVRPGRLDLYYAVRGVTTPEEAGSLRGGLIQVPRCEPSSLPGRCIVRMRSHRHDGR